jgi:hypothetical protein
LAAKQPGSLNRFIVAGAALLALSAYPGESSPTAGTQLIGASSFPGVWEMQGHALIVDIGPEEVVYYDTTRVSCIESDRKPVEDLAGRFPGGVVGQGPDWVVVRDHAQPYRLQRLPQLPQRCRGVGTVGSDAVLNFETFWHYLRENYAGGEVRGVDWEAIYRAHRPGITSATTTDELWAAYSAILAPLDDVHVFITNGRSGAENRTISSARTSGLREALLVQNPSLGEEESYALDAEMQRVLDSYILYDLLDGRFSTALQDKFRWGWAAEGIGYLNIAMMMRLFETPATDPEQVRSAVHETMERVMADFASADALIIDVRQNRGGSDGVASEIASHFADRPLSRRTRARTPIGYTDWWQTEVQPHGVGFNKPVYLLVSENTVSAAEMLALYLREYASVTLVGETTRGAFSTILFKRLPDGSSIGIANEQATGITGETIEARGIEPDVFTPVFSPDRLVSGYRDAVDLAIRLARP